MRLREEFESLHTDGHERTGGRRLDGTKSEVMRREPRLSSTLNSVLTGFSIYGRDDSTPKGTFTEGTQLQSENEHNYLLRFVLVDIPESRTREKTSVSKSTTGVEESTEIHTNYKVSNSVNPEVETEKRGQGETFRVEEGVIDVGSHTTGGV